MKEYAKTFYKSKAWQRTRTAYAQSIGGLCEECLSNGIYRAGKIVHHIKEISPDTIDNPEVTLSWDNLRLLCVDCHAKVHGDFKRYRVDDQGKVIMRME
jgi:5-methylcytosine-specific restriction endonuclease McrA